MVCCLYGAKKGRATDKIGERVRGAAGVPLPHLIILRSLDVSSSSLPAIKPINSHFFKPSSPRSPFQHHLATEGGCHGNATHMSRLPSLLPWQLVPHRISSMSLSVSLSLSYSLWVCLSFYFSHESVPTCLIRLSVPGKSLIAGLVSFSHHSLLVVYTPFTVYHLLNTAPCWVEQKFICIIIL